MPHLKALVERFQDQPFVIVGVNVGDSDADYRAGIKEHGLSWISAFEGKGEAPIAKAWGVNAFPTMHIIDAEGRIRGLDLRGGPVDRMIEKLLAEAQAKREQGAAR